ILTSTTRFIAHPAAAADPWKRAKMDDLVLMLQGAMGAEGKVGLMMNVRKKDKDRVLAALPALQRPTISELSDPEWIDVMTIIDEEKVRHMIAKLKAAGATGIFDYPSNKGIVWTAGTPSHTIHLSPAEVNMPRTTALPWAPPAAAPAGKGTFAF